MCIHGGGWMGGKRQDCGPLATLLAQHGYVAVTISYRFAPQHKFPAQIEDAKAAVRWLRANAEKYGVDKDRIGAIGFSAGGHLASLLGVTDKNDGLEGASGSPDESSRVRAVVNFFGPTDLTINDWSKTAYHGILIPVLGGTFEEHPELYKRMSPATYATKDDAPTLFFHGAKDDLVGVRHSVDMAAKLKGLGIESRAVVLPDAGHGWNGLDLINTMQESVEFFDAQLKPAKK
ncbi:MAG: alpha/beta hydrolase [Pirellulales bacterium]